MLILDFYPKRFRPTQQESIIFFTILSFLLIAAEEQENLSI